MNDSDEGEKPNHQATLKLIKLAHDSTENVNRSPSANASALSHPRNHVFDLKQSSIELK
jgi:hypothetical protein